MKRLALIFALFSVPAWTQTCTTATCTAANTSQAAVLAALPNGSAPATVVVNIPAGTSSWTTPLTYSIPSNVTNLTIQGATTVSCTGMPGQSNYTCPATDSTNIQDSFTPNGQNQLIHITTGVSSTYLRITGITFVAEPNAAKNNGLLYIDGASANVRIDHTHWNENTQNDSMIQVGSSTLGVVDHNRADLGGNTNVGNFFRDFATSDGAWGDAAWNAATNWGSWSTFWSLESNEITGGSPTDCYNGASLVIRYNTINNIYVMAIHGTKNDAGRGRGCRAVDLNNNYVKGTTNGTAVIGPNAGTAMMWGNNVASGENHFNAPGAPRNFIGGDSGTATWDGMCGSSINGGSTTSYYDGNTPTTLGYPCLDGIGRGQGNLLSGSPATPHAWPSQFLEPEYMFKNTLAAADEGYINDISSQYNRDIYPDCGNAGSACSGSFNGTQGTGFGLHSARPVACTAGPGGTFGTSPTGSYGVGYWETDTNSFWVCTSPNTWTNIYTPPAYPHPLVGGTTYNLTVSTAGTGSGTLSGTNCVSSAYTAGTPVVCVPSPNTGSTFNSFSGGTCSGSSCSFSMPTSAVNVVATFDINSYTLSTATTGTGSGTITGCSGARNFGASYSCTVTATSGTLAGVSGCGGSGTTTYTGTMPAGNCTVTATFVAQVATPTASPVAGTYSSTQNVALSSGTAGATICYRLDGVNPSTSSPGTCGTGSFQYVSPISVSTSLTIKYLASKIGYTDSSIASSAYVIANVLATPSLTPFTGVPPVIVSISSTDQTFSPGITVTEGSNSNASNGSSPHGNTYTNCATSCIAGVWQPVNSGSVSNGQLACTTAAQASGVANGCTARSVVSATITATGSTALSNGQGAGGTYSLDALTYTAGGTYTGTCSGTSGSSQLVPGISLPGAVASAEEIYSGTTDATNFNTSLLGPRKWAFASGDSYVNYIRQTCQSVPTTTSAGFHLEFDLNHTLSNHEYIGPGIHYNFTDSKWYYCFQGCGSWSAMKEVETNGTVHTTLPFPAGHDLYTEIYYHRTAACDHTSGSNCEFIDSMCVKDFTAGGALTCYSLIDAGTNLQVGGIPVLESGFTASEFNLQHQLDFNASAVTRSVTVHFDNAISYSTSGPKFCVTTDGSTPAASTPGTCSNGTEYTGPFLVSTDPTTVKVIATQVGKTNSAVASVTYASLPTFTWTATATNGSLTGTNCANSSYTTGQTIGACTAVPNTGYPFTSWSAVSGSAGCSGATNPCPGFIINANSAATANFTINNWTLSTVVAGSGTGTITGCAGAHNYNAAYSCTMTPTGGSTLASVTGCGGSGTTTYTGNMPNAACTVTATFNPPAPTVQVQIAGTVKFSGSGRI